MSTVSSSLASAESSQVGQSPASLAQEIDNILLDVKTQEQLVKNAALLVKSDANELLTKEIFNFK